jgi:hypothetical protein
MSDWNEFSTQNDIDKLLDIYGGFHDSCIVSMHYRSGTFVDDKKTMYFGDSSEHELIVVFHRQWEPRAIEMRFIGLRQLHLTGWQDNYSCDIYDAHLSFYEGILPGTPSRVIVWANYYDFNIKEIDNTIHEPSDTYIVANALKWRIIDNND